MKLAFVVTFLLILFLGLGLVSASEANMDDSISLTDNTDSLKTTSDNNNNIAIDDVEESNDNNNLLSNSTVTNSKGDGEEIKSTNDVLNFSSLNETINSGSSDLIVLENNYAYDENTDSRFIALGGIFVSRDLTIDGQGNYIDLGGKLRFISTLVII
ncbi:hypothetical protein [uncultured Methanobrevibacter sp.]|uniref:hypothetical protein n=1 Tax=uncultured Methanobrevibacter sp. TaxID=253161 RepID=UPI0025FC0465|nr:hypothetical protein [uncultured Methanobrevibacter sp.]